MNDNPECGGHWGLWIHPQHSPSSSPYLEILGGGCSMRTVPASGAPWASTDPKLGPLSLTTLHAYLPHRCFPRAYTLVPSAHDALEPHSKVQRTGETRFPHTPAPTSSSALPGGVGGDWG